MALTDNIIPLAGNLFWVKGPGKGKYPFCNGFLITGKETLLIDAGMGEDLIREIDAQCRIDCLLISHSHPDHILQWHVLRDRELLMPAETPDCITDIEQLAIRFTGSAENAVHWIRNVEGILGLRPMRFPDRRFSDGDTIDVGGHRLTAIHTPGHLDDHYCFLFEESVLLTTDIDFCSFGPWYGNPESDIDRFKRSIQKVRDLTFDLVCSSHKPPIVAKNAQQAFDDYLAIFDRQLKLVEDLCGPSGTFEEMLTHSPFYQNKMPDQNMQKIFEGKMIRKNLDSLLLKGVIEEVNERYHLIDRY